MLTLEQLQTLIYDRSLPRVSEATGLSIGILRIIRDDEHANPTIKTMKTLSDYFAKDLKI
jgi:hypothetical protein